MTSDRIGFLMALLGIGLCGACGSSPALSIEADADITAAGSAPDGGSVGGAGGNSSSTGFWGPSSGEMPGGGMATGGDPGAGGAIGGGAPYGSGGSAGESSDSDRKIKSGTVAMDKLMGAATATCQQVLRLDNPAQSLIGYIQTDPSSYKNDPRAGEPSYVYLDGGKDAVSLPGPAVTYDATNVDVSGAKLVTCVNEETACLGQDGYRVQVNDRLSYVINIDDWEEEAALGRVELCLNNGALSTQFVFAGLGVYLGGGVAHDITIKPILDGIPGTPTTPLTIECRTE